MRRRFVLPTMSSTAWSRFGVLHYSGPGCGSKEGVSCPQTRWKTVLFRACDCRNRADAGDSVVQHRLANWQRRWNPLWNKVGCGCHLIRDTRKVFSDQGFQFEDYSAYRHPKIIGLVSPVIQGTAIKPL